jgi:NAD(P)-dependent dehydrogenase (short-subunit alcohol dehydrogenase family)
MNVDVEQPVVLITGASRGIGREIALAYAKRGARLVLAARTPEALAAVGREAESLGAQVLAIPTDITSDANLETLVASAVDRFRRIDGNYSRGLPPGRMNERLTT